jgi:hypothetical protein
MSDRFDILERLEPLFDVPEPSFEGFVRRRDRRRRSQRITAGLVGIAVFLAAMGLIARSPSERGIAPAGDGGTQVEETRSILGLPNPEAAPSKPKHGELILYLEGSSGTSPWTALWAYADGRIIWGDVGGTFPVDAPTRGATGFVEQHLTPAGVEYLRNQVTSTGLFEDDLELKLDASGFLTIEVLAADRLVKLLWAVDDNGIVPNDTPTATPEQASALEGLQALLAHPISWPAYVWENRHTETFVPSRYRVWLRIFAHQGAGRDLSVGAREVGLLPLPARNLLERATKVNRSTYELTTDDTRAFAEALIAGGLEPMPSMPLGEPVTRFELPDPYEPGSTLFLFFGPVLPHGEAVFLGPG